MRFLSLGLAVALAVLALGCDTGTRLGGSADGITPQEADALRAENLRLERENQELRGQLAAARRGAAPAGAPATGGAPATAGAAVDAAAVSEPAAEPPADTAAAAPPVSSGDVSSLGEPVVMAYGKRVTVSGRLLNGGAGNATGVLKIDLLRDGEVVGSQEQQLELPPGREQEYFQTFEVRPGSGRYTTELTLAF